MYLSICSNKLGRKRSKLVMWARAWARSAAGAATLQRGIMGKIIPLHESGRRSNAMGTQKQMQRAAQADEMLDKVPANLLNATA